MTENLMMNLSMRKGWRIFGFGLIWLLAGAVILAQEADEEMPLNELLESQAARLFQMENYGGKKEFGKPALAVRGDRGLK